MGDIYEASSWDELRCHDIHTKFHKHWVRYSKVVREGLADVQTARWSHKSTFICKKKRKADWNQGSGDKIYGSIIIYARFEANALISPLTTKAWAMKTSGLTRIREVLGSNLSRGTGYPLLIFWYFSFALPRKFRNGMAFTPRPSPNSFQFTVHLSSYDMNTIQSSYWQRRETTHITRDSQTLQAPGSLNANKKLQAPRQQRGKCRSHKRCHSKNLLTYKII
jgi:hypothetical protein